MHTHGVFVYNPRRHDIGSRLEEILRSHFDGAIHVFDEYPEKLPPHHANARRLFFFIMDGSISLQELERASQLPDVWKLCVFSGGECEDFVRESCFGLFDDVLYAPLREDEVLLRLRRFTGVVEDDEREVAKRNLLQKLGLAQIFGRDPVFLEAIAKIPQLARSDASVLLSGETGVGKVLCARAIHYLGKRSDKSFVTFDCCAVPPNLMENELFGHRRGAYTDARSNQQGLISEAEGGTLFLDEIDSLDTPAQSKLLRLLQDKTYRPLGESRESLADIRIIAATNTDLWKKVEEGRFRQDLYYRLNLTLHLPPLRERRSDIPLLAEHYVEQYRRESGRGRVTLSSGALRKLLHYDWRGNIRELENVIQQAIMFNRSSIISASDLKLPSEFRKAPAEKLSFREAKRQAIEAFEKRYVQELLLACQGNITTAARRAQKDRADFSRLVKKYRLGSSSVQ